MAIYHRYLKNTLVAKKLYASKINLPLKSLDSVDFTGDIRRKLTLDEEDSGVLRL